VKRTRNFLLWALMFWAFALMVGSRIAIAYRVMQDVRLGLHPQMIQAQVSLEFFSHYWHVTLACATLFAGVGSVTGVLPGTGKIKPAEPPPPLPPQ
jgi:hypothetical protein